MLGEALSNMARHAHATAASILVEGTSDAISLTVGDNGVGLTARAPRGDGLNNLRRRAERLGGTAGVDPGDTGGTTLHWRVPPSSS